MCLINEDMTNKLVNLEIIVVKATSIEVVKVMKKLFEYCKHNGQTLKTFFSDQVKSNSRPLKELIKKGQLDSIDIKEGYLKEIKRELNKYGVNFSIMKHKEDEIYSLFFQSKNTAVIEMAFKKVIEKSQERNKESINLIIRKFKDKIKENVITDKLKNKRKEKSL